MKVLQLPSWFLPEGGQFFLDQSKALQEQGVDVTILANVVLPWRKYKLSVFQFPFRAFYDEQEGIPVFRYYSWRIPLLAAKNADRWIARTVRLIEQYILENGQPDIIHVQSSMWAGVAAAIIKDKYGIPYVITEHRGIFSLSCDYSKNIFQAVNENLLRRAFSNANYIIPVSMHLMNEISMLCDKNVPVKEISNLLDTDYFHPIERKRDKSTIRFISVNGFYFVKAYDILLPAFDKLCDELDNVELRIVGANFDDSSFLELYNACKHKDKISFAGHLDKEGVRTELWDADVFVIASRVEAQSVATVEALCTGLPVVCTEEIPLYLVNEQNGYRVPVENVSELVKAMQQMANKYKNFDSLDIAQKTKAIVDKAVVAKQIMEVYDLVLRK